MNGSVKLIANIFLVKVWKLLHKHSPDEEIPMVRPVTDLSDVTITLAVIGPFGYWRKYV